jgi:hypothetical protein
VAPEESRVELGDRTRSGDEPHDPPIVLGDERNPARLRRERSVQLS